MPGIDDLIKCQLCNSTFKEPFTLPCFHTFCRSCISNHMNSGKFTCKLCEKTENVPGGNIEKAFKASQLAGFLLLLKTDEFKKTTEEDKVEKEGVCQGCAPPPSKKADAPPPPVSKLTICFHCQNALCQNCKTKHYDQQKAETLKNLEKFQEGAGNVRITTEQLNAERKNRISDYGKLKSEITKKHQELIEKLKKEEIELHKSVDEEIKNVENKIKTSEGEAGRLKAYNETALNLKQKIATESDERKRAEMCLAVAKVQQEWLDNLKGESAKADPSKEQKLVYNTPKFGNNILGGFDHKKADSKVKQGGIPGEKSGVCTIL